MGKIKVLDQQVAELIAAGEVVERPASIVKEMVENSLDAGADRITVEIRGGGIKYIRIKDNGTGIAREDLPNAFIRHATSKITSAEDLNRIMTFGFRGEALASIAAVCQVEIITKTKEEIIGSRFIIDGMESGEMFDIGCPVGTDITVKNVFYNTPARLKFLKKDSFEGSKVINIIEKLAMINSGVSFKVIKNGEVVMNTPGNSNLKDSVHSIMGSDFSKHLIEVDYNFNNLKISGFISEPRASKATRAMQNFYINNRYIKSKTCVAALEEAYIGCMMTGKFPGCVLNIEIPADTVDVNVHPAKTEVRFSDEKAIYDLVYSACKTAIQIYNENNAIRIPGESKPKPKINEFVLKDFDYSKRQMDFSDFEAEPKKTEKTYENLNSYSQPFTYSTNEPSESKKAEVNQSSDIQKLLDRVRKNSFSSLNNKNEEEKESFSSDLNLEVKSNLPEAAEADEIFENNAFDDFEDREISVSDTLPVKFSEDDNPQNKKEESDYRIIGELFCTYILIEKGNSFFMIDKHAAHERYLYNQIKKEKIVGQLLFEPILVKLEEEDYLNIKEKLDVFEQIGYKVKDEGNCQVSLSMLPTMLSQNEAVEEFKDIAGKIEFTKELTPKAIDDIYHSIACRKAVKANDFTGYNDQKALVDIIINDEEVSYCPHGRPVLIEFTKNRIERMFGRIV